MQTERVSKLVKVYRHEIRKEKNLNPQSEDIREESADAKTIALMVELMSQDESENDSNFVNLA